MHNKKSLLSSVRSIAIMMSILSTFLLVKTHAYFLHSVVMCDNQYIVHYNDSVESAVTFHNWLDAWQGTCDNRQYWTAEAVNSGIGASINLCVKNLAASIEHNNIYRPLAGKDDMYAWMWADERENCSTKTFQSIDCFLEPLSLCYSNATSVTATDKEKYAKDIQFSGASDTCNLASKLHKPLQWLTAQLYVRFFRYTAKVQDRINQRLYAVYGLPAEQKKKKDSKNSTTIAVHIRGGDPDQGRVVLAVDTYMKYVDEIAVKAAAQGKPVGIVYLCSHTQEENIISAEHMHAKYNRTYKFVVLPHASTGPGESEHALRNASLVNKPHNSILTTEFYADVEILAASDYFIGSHSNVYNLVVALRIARGTQKYLNQSCYVDTRDKEIYCEGSHQVKELWRGAQAGVGKQVSFSNPNIEMDWYDPYGEFKPTVAVVV